jgi:multisubunit Na+/H+ antiporter MnhC subunit
MSVVLSYFNYWVVVLLMMIGFYGVIAHGNMDKKLMALGLFCETALRFIQTRCRMC